MAARWVVIQGFVMALAGCVPDSATGFIAFTRDFEGFAEWPAIERAPELIPPTHALGRSTIYVNRTRDPQTGLFPVGTIIVRVTRLSETDVSQWQIHAMAKRGNNFNALGARDWEFFALDLMPGINNTQRIWMRWRGTGPVNGDGYVGPDGGDVLSCNQCHGSAVDTDSLLAPELAPQRP